MPSKESTKESWRSFVVLCSEMRSHEELNQFFDLFLTIEEKETLASRYMIIKGLLQEELTQREISEEYKVSIAQITRGSNALKIIDSELREHLKLLLKK